MFVQVQFYWRSGFFNLNAVVEEAQWKNKNI